MEDIPWLLWYPGRPTIPPSTHICFFFFFVLLASNIIVYSCCIFYLIFLVFDNDEDQYLIFWSLLECCVINILSTIHKIYVGCWFFVFMPYRYFQLRSIFFESIGYDCDTLLSWINGNFESGHIVPKFLNSRFQGYCRVL